MKTGNDEEVVFHMDVFLILRNLAFVLLLMAGICFLLSKGDWGLFFKIFPILCGLLGVYALASEQIVLIKINRKKGDANFEMRRFVFFRQKIVLKFEEFYYSYKYELGARGAKRIAFCIYNQDRKRIVSIVPQSSGWSVDKLKCIMEELKELKIEEIT